MSDQLLPRLKGCLVLVTSDGEHYQRTRIADVTPSGRYIRLESDGLTPEGLERWRAFSTLQILDAFASPAAPAVMHGIVRLKPNAVPHRPPPAIFKPASPDAEQSNIIEFPSPVPQKTSVSVVASRASLGG